MVDDLSNNIIWAALQESQSKMKPGSPPPLMIDAMMRGLNRYKKLDDALGDSDLNNPMVLQYREALQRYAAKIESYYEACGEYPSVITLPKPTNDAESYVWLLVEAFLQYKTGKKPRLQAAA